MVIFTLGDLLSQKCFMNDNKNIYEVLMSSEMRSSKV